MEFFQPVSISFYVAQNDGVPCRILPSNRPLWTANTWGRPWEDSSTSSSFYTIQVDGLRLM
jgi:hypothetical protein